MKTKNIVKKAVVLGAGLVMVGTTLAGAMAYNLNTYPAQFIKDGQFNGKIVVGEKAATADVLGAIDIAASLQAASVKVDGTDGGVNLVGDSHKLSTGADQLELREPIGNVIDTITSSDLAGLKSGKITTAEGTTSFNQYIRLKDGTNLQDMTVNYVENDNRQLADYLVVDTSKPFMEYELQFPEGLTSKLNSNNELTDLQDRQINILGEDFTIVKANVDPTGNNFGMTLMGGAASDTLHEGETKTFTVNGVDYEVTLVFISDPNSGKPQVKFSVNGELTQALGDGDTDTLSGGVQIGVRDILVNAREGVASFFLGAHKIVISDSTTNVANGFNGHIEIDNENINDGEVTVLGQFTSPTKFELTSIKYRLTMDAQDGTTAYVASGHGLKEFMRRPKSLISNTLDIKYAGLEQSVTKDVFIKSRGQNKYDMTFTNTEGQTYTFPLAQNVAGALKLGNDKDDLFVVEAANSSTFPITRDDYFVVSNDRGAGDADKSVTNVLRYEDYDATDRTIDLRDLGNNNVVSVPVSVSGVGDLVIGGHTYKVYVSNVTSNSPNLAIDLNGDGIINGAKVTATVWGGVVINLANTLTTSELSQTATVLSKNFDTSTAAETFNWKVLVANSDELNLNFNQSSYSGPLAGTNGDVNEFQFTNLNDNTNVGLTDYGILIKERTPNNDPNDLTLTVPKTQKFAQVFITMGDVTTVAGGTQSVNPIGVGLAVLDKDVLPTDNGNIIVVGGPCVNTVAAALLGNPVKCAEGFEPGKAVIKSFEKNGKIAILVAGYEGQDTRGASIALAQYGAYLKNMNGTEAQVIVADLKSVKVTPIK